MFLNLFRLRFSGYLRKTGRTEESRRICQQGIESIRNSLGKNSIFLTQAYGSLGSTEHLAGRNEQAAAAYREAIRIYQIDRDKRGPEKYARLRAECHSKLGRALNLLGDFDGAEEAFCDSVVIRRRYTDGESTVAPPGLVMALLSTDGNVVSQESVSRKAAFGNPAGAVSIARNWMRAASTLESKSQSPSEEDDIVIESLRLGALAFIAQAVKNGFSNRRKLVNTKEFEALRDDKRFRQLLNRISARKARK